MIVTRGKSKRDATFVRFAVRKRLLRDGEELVAASYEETRIFLDGEALSTEFEYCFYVARIADIVVLKYYKKNLDGSLRFNLTRPEEFEIGEIAVAQSRIMVLCNADKVGTSNPIERLPPRHWKRYSNRGGHSSFAP